MSTTVEQPAPSAYHDRAARFCAVISAKLLRQQEVPRVVWEEHPGALGHVKHSETSLTASGVIPEGGKIYLSPSWFTSMKRLPEVVAHETFHLTHHRAWHNRTYTEPEAIDFGKRWGDPLLKAGSAVGWDPARASLMHESHPDELLDWQITGTRVGDVVIAIRSGDCWQYDGRWWSAL